MKCRPWYLGSRKCNSAGRRAQPLLQHMHHGLTQYDRMVLPARQSRLKRCVDPENAQPDPHSPRSTREFRPALGVSGRESHVLATKYYGYERTGRAASTAVSRMRIILWRHLTLC